MRRTALAGLGLALLVGLGACASKTPPQTESAAATPAPPVSPAAGSTSTPAVQGPAPLPKKATVTVTSVRIDAIDVRTTKVEKLGLLDDGSLAAPEDPDRAGWFVDGTVPGDVGPAVIAGHVDSETGPAVFFDLREVERGDKVVVGLSNGKRTTFRVDDVVTTPKKGFPTERVFGPTPDRELRLITCGGPYDRSVGSYVDNTVVFATAV